MMHKRQGSVVEVMSSSRNSDTMTGTSGRYQPTLMSAAQTDFIRINRYSAASPRSQSNVIYLESSKSFLTLGAHVNIHGRLFARVKSSRDLGVADFCAEI